MNVFFISVSARFPTLCPFIKTVSTPIKSTTIPSSCRGRCFTTTNRSPMLECMCDKACLFLGDCCRDYLLQCGRRKMNITHPVHEQYPVFRHFGQYSSCIRSILSGRIAHKMVNTCPSSFNDSSEIKSMCTYSRDKSTMSSCMPVESDGVLYRNMYCAACHGRPLHQLYPVPSSGFWCISEVMEEYDSNLLPFVSNIDCNSCKLTVHTGFNYLNRYGDACWCHQALPDRSCDDPFHEKWCNAYSKVVYDKYRQPYNNKACKTCDNDGAANVSRPDHCSCTYYEGIGTFGFEKLLDFTDMSLPSVHDCSEYYKRGKSGNLCLNKHCQNGFEVHDDICMSMATVEICYPPKQNRHNSAFLIANLFQPALIIHYEAANPNESLFSGPRFVNLEHRPCTHLPILYDTLLPQGSRSSIQCALLYCDPMAFAKLSGDLSNRDISKEFFPEVDVLQIMLLNHDPLSGISCSGGIRRERLGDMQVIKGGIVRVRSQKSKQPFLSNKDPLAVMHRKHQAGVEIWAFVCKPSLEVEKCRAHLVEEKLSPMTSCLKYELTDDIAEGTGTVLLKSGKTLSKEQFMYTDNGTILVCANEYDKLHQILSNAWSTVVTGSYTAPLVCMFVTFIM